MLYLLKKLTNFVEFKKDVQLKLYDIPGLNDSETKKTYYNYLDYTNKEFNFIS